MKPITFRPPFVAGMFYPAQRSKLSQDLEQMLNHVNVTETQGNLMALIVPHAGYEYSGTTAAHAYSLLKHHSVDSVVIVAPSHREYFDGISVYNGSGYLTPLGEMRVDVALRSALLNDDTIITSSEKGHGSEHAIEVHLPFLHGKNMLLIASSDLSHYHTYHEAEQLDQIFIDDVKAFNEEQLMKSLEEETTEACGGGPTIAVMTAAKLLGANQVNILHHCNSGDVTGDHSQVVGYLSAALFRTN
jgi:predicted class III extradiol MEMO1 family dioxygenase